jgi:hypothetical protein
VYNETGISRVLPPIMESSLLETAELWRWLTSFQIFMSI